MSEVQELGRKIEEGQKKLDFHQREAAWWVKELENLYRKQRVATEEEARQARDGLKH